MHTVIPALLPHRICLRVTGASPQAGEKKSSPRVETPFLDWPLVNWVRAKPPLLALLLLLCPTRAESALPSPGGITHCHPSPLLAPVILLHNYLGTSLLDPDPPESRCSLAQVCLQHLMCKVPQSPGHPSLTCPSTLAPISLGWGWPSHLLSSLLIGECPLPWVPPVSYHLCLVAALNRREQGLVHSYFPNGHTVGPQQIRAP